MTPIGFVEGGTHLYYEIFCLSLKLAAVITVNTVMTMWFLS